MSRLKFPPISSDRCFFLTNDKGKREVNIFYWCLIAIRKDLDCNNLHRFLNFPRLFCAYSQKFGVTDDLGPKYSSPSNVEICIK